MCVYVCLFVCRFKCFAFHCTSRRLLVVRRRKHINIAQLQVVQRLVRQVIDLIVLQVVATVGAGLFLELYDCVRVISIKQATWLHTHTLAEEKTWKRSKKWSNEKINHDILRVDEHRNVCWTMSSIMFRNFSLKE